MPKQPRITADFNFGGRDGDIGIVYLTDDTLRQLNNAGIELREGMALTLSDFDGTAEEPTWLVAPGIVRQSNSGGSKSVGWRLVYRWDECRWESRGD